ncbi:hypothetical protein RIF29_13567 [Crotalaria pallida]|uniref:Uncharacterized protein n=1 Tax=Crotalaria pallida TaxID=3830 RepID=A0AAN9P316_CROPI
MVENNNGSHEASPEARMIFQFHDLSSNFEGWLMAIDPVCSEAKSPKLNETVAFTTAAKAMITTFLSSLDLD